MQSSRGPRRPLRAIGRVLRIPGLKLGILVALLVLGAGAYVQQSQPVRWTVETDLLLAPNLTDPGLETSSYFDTLSNGQLPATAAEILSEQGFVSEIKRDNDIPADVDVSIAVAQVPETAIVRATITAPSRETAILVARELPPQAIPTVNRLLSPYALTGLGDPTDSVTQTSLNQTQWLVVVLAAALLLGVGIQQVVLQLARARRGVAPTHAR